MSLPALGSEPVWHGERILVRNTQKTVRRINGKCPICLIAHWLRSGGELAAREGLDCWLRLRAPLPASRTAAVISIDGTEIVMPVFLRGDTINGAGARKTQKHCNGGARTVEFLLSNKLAILVRWMP